MGDSLPPEIKVIHPDVEILPPDHTEPRPAAGGRRIWLAVDSHGSTRRVYVAKPGPFTTFLLVLAFGALLVVSFVVALGLFAVLLSISAVVMSGLLIFGLARSVFNRLR